MPTWACYMRVDARSTHTSPLSTYSYVLYSIQKQHRIEAHAKIVKINFACIGAELELA